MSLVPTRASTSLNDKLFTQPARNRLGYDEDEIVAPTGTFTTLIATTFSGTTLTVTNLNAAAIAVASGTIGALNSNTLTATSVNTDTLTCAGTYAATTITTTDTTTTNATVTGTLNAGGLTGDFVATSKGDLVTRSATAMDRLPVGTDGQVLIADSTQPLGLRWGTSSGAQMTPSTLGTTYGRVDTTNHNHSVGENSLLNLTTYTSAAALGDFAGSDVTDGSGGSVFVGSGADTAAGTIGTRIAIGRNAFAQVDGEMALPLAIEQIRAAGLAAKSSGEFLAWAGGLIGRAVALTAKADILGYNGTAYQRLAAGTNRYVLRANSSAATGLEWSTWQGHPNLFWSLGFVGPGGQSVSNNITTTLAFGTDTDGNGFITQNSGVYFIAASVMWQNSTSGTRYCRINAGGVNAGEVENQNETTSAYQSQMITRLVNIPAARIVTIDVRQTSGGTLTVQGKGSPGPTSTGSWMAYVYIGAP